MSRRGEMWYNTDMSCEREVPHAVKNYRELVKEDGAGSGRCPAGDGEVAGNCGSNWRALQP